MKIFLSTLIVLLSVEGQSFAANPDIDDTIVVSLLATDTNSKAEGTRKSTSILKMVLDPADRKADISIDSSNSSNLNLIGSGYPKWSGNGVVGTDGATTAKWNGGVGTKVYCEYALGKKEEIEIDIDSNQSLDIKIDSDKFKGYIKAANNLINAISEVEDPFKINGSLKGKSAFCDMYNDGSSLGKSFGIDGEISLDANLLDIKKVIPTTIGALSLRTGIKLDAFSIKVSGKFTFDEGKQNPWLASSGSISGGSAVSVVGEAILGLASDKGDVGVIVSVTGSSSIKATGTITGENRNIYAQGKGEAGKLTVKGSLSCRFGSLGTWQIGSVDAVLFDGDSGETEKVEIYSF